VLSYLQLFSVLRKFVTLYRGIMFAVDYAFCEDLCLEVLRRFQYINTEIRSHAISFLYFLIKSNWDEHGNFLFMKSISSIALSKLIPTIKRQDILKNSFDYLTTYPIMEYAPDSNQLDQQQVALKMSIIYRKIDSIRDIIRYSTQDDLRTIIILLNYVLQQLNIPALHIQGLPITIKKNVNLKLKKCFGKLEAN